MAAERPDRVFKEAVMTPFHREPCETFSSLEGQSVGHGNAHDALPRKKTEYLVLQRVRSASKAI